MLLAVVQNAAQAISGNDGFIRVTTGHVTSDVIQSPHSRLGLEDRPYVRISITDSGSGIDARNTGKVFEPFFTTREGAAVLAMSDAYGIVTKDGGKITIAPEPAGGTTVHVLIPETDQPEPSRS